MNAIRYFAAACLLIVLAGCQEIQGPVWSSNGEWIAHTVYSRRAEGGGFGTSVYLSNPGAEDPGPKLLAADAAFPKWAPGAKMLYFLGARDPQGFYTKIMKYTPGDEKPAIALDGVRLTGMQLAADKKGPVVLLLQGRDSQPGSMVRTELWNPTDNKRTDLRGLGDMYGPALSFNGKMIVYGSKPADGHVVLMATDIGGEPQAVFPTAATPETNASGYVVHPFPNSERFLFYGPGLPSIWVMSGQSGAYKFARHPIPDGLAGPVMARVAEDSNSALVTMLRATPGKVGYESYRLDFAPTRWNKLDGNADEPIGGAALDPTWKKGEPLRVAWLAPAGLAVGDPAKPPRFLPVTADQHLAASALMLKSNDAAHALESALKAADIKPPPDNPDALSHSLYAAYMANKQFERVAEVCEQGWLLSPVKQAGVQYLFPPDSGLPPPAPEWVAVELKRLDEVIAAVPDNHMLPLLKEAFNARLKGDQAGAIVLYRKGLKICGDKAAMGGMYFLMGMTAVEMFDPQTAGEYFEQAARTDDFPQNDFAAGLSAMAYLLHGRQESLMKGAAVLQLPAAKKSRFAAEFTQLTTLMREKKFKEHTTTPEVVSKDGAAHVWVVNDALWIPFAAARPVRMEAEVGKFSERYLGPERMVAASIFTNKSPLPILRVARPVTLPKLSPSGMALAFTVSGDVFPVPDNFCDLIVLDLAGGVFTGNIPAAMAGKTKGRVIFSNFEWNGDAEIKTSGVEVDVFGAQKPFQRMIPLGRLGSGKRP